MLLKDKNKGLVTVIMKRLQGSNSSEAPEPVKMKDGAEQDDSIALDSAAEEMMQAIKSGNASEFKNALKSFISMCQDED